MNRTTSALAGLILVGTAAAFVIPEVLSSDISGYASVVDGDTIHLNGERIRLWGIDAPELSQTCNQGAWQCGLEAKRTLERMLNHPVTCVPKDKDRYGRIVARCATPKGDIAERLVGLGYALDWPNYSGGYYRDAQDAAQRDRVGMWAGDFVAPWEWRRK